MTDLIDCMQAIESYEADKESRKMTPILSIAVIGIVSEIKQMHSIPAPDPRYPKECQFRRAVI